MYWGKSFRFSDKNNVSSMPFKNLLNKIRKYTKIGVDEQKYIHREVTHNIIDGNNITKSVFESSNCDTHTKVTYTK